MDYKPDIVFYHANCNDGFASAWVVWSSCGKDQSIRFVPVQYGNDLPNLDYTGLNVMIVDFSFPADDLEKIALAARSVVVLDHHKSAANNLDKFPNVHGLKQFDVEYMLEHKPEVYGSGIIASFDMERSGAMMAWDFFRSEEAPKLIKHVEDRDLWRFVMPHTASIHLMLSSLPMTFEAWDEAADELEEDPLEFIEKASAASRFFYKKVGEVAETAEVMEFDGYAGVPVVHCPWFMVSDTCSHLLSMDEHENAPFAMAVVHAYGKKTYSLRSRGDVDVSVIAEKYGGGGHVAAAGFRD